MTTLSPQTAFTNAPVRNRLRVQLTAPVADVWALIGDLTRFPEYSSGLARVDVTPHADGSPATYVCHFKPREQGQPGLVHRELIRWYQPLSGYASSAEDQNAFGLINDVNLVTLEPSADGTLLTWEERFDAEALDMNRAAYDEALADIAEHLVRRFGGEVVERYVDETTPGTR